MIKKPKLEETGPEGPVFQLSGLAAARSAAIIAAITAAISLMLAESGDATYQGGFRVVSFKRSNRNTPWNSGR